MELGPCDEVDLNGIVTQWCKVSGLVHDDVMVWKCLPHY